MESKQMKWFLYLENVMKIAGADAVGMGSDFDGIEYVAAGLEDVSKFPNLTRGLVDKFVWLKGMVIGAGGENKLGGPRRRSEWTFIGRFVRQ